jgi:biotin carboxylase
MEKIIYIVGKPHLQATEIEMIRHMGLGVGLLQDTSIHIKNPERFDRIVPADFSSNTSIIESLRDIELHAVGLICTFENYIVAKSLIAEHLNLPALSVVSALKSTDKYLMRQAFMEYDATITPKFALVSNKQELLAAANAMQFPLILKPTNLVKSLLVLKCNNLEELKNNFAYAKKNIAYMYKKYLIHGRKPQLILEEFIQGKMCSIAAFVDDQGNPHFCEGIVGLTTAQECGIDDNYIFERLLPITFEDIFRTRLLDVATKGIKSLEMRSVPAHVELMYDDNHIKLIEIGARTGGYRPRMYDMSYGIDLISQEIKLATGKFPELEGAFQSFTAVWEIFAENEGRFKELTGLINKQLFTYFRVQCKVDEPTGPAKNGYKAAAVIIANTKDEATLATLREHVKHVRVRTEP